MKSVKVFCRFFISSVFLLVTFLSTTLAPAQDIYQTTQGHLLSIDKADRLTVGDLDFLRRDIQANSYRRSTQKHTTLLLDESGGLFVVWDSRRQDKGGYGVFAQRFNPFGKRIGKEIKINTTHYSTQWKPTITQDSSKEIWIGWESFIEKESRFNCIARKFDSTLSPLSGENPISIPDGCNHWGLNLTPVAGKGFVATWTSDNLETGRSKVYYRLFNNDGANLSNPILVDDRADTSEMVASVASQKDGSFVVVWASIDRGILARIINHDGKPVSGILKIDENSDINSIEPHVDIRPEGGFVVAWLDAKQEGDGYSVSARIFDRNGLPAGSAFEVRRKSESCQSGAVVSVSSDDRFCIAWNEMANATGDMDVMAKIYKGASASSLPAFRVSGNAKGRQELVASAGKNSVQFGPSGQLAFSWSGPAGLCDRKSANVTLLIPVANGLKGDIDSSGVCDGNDLELLFDIVTGDDFPVAYYGAADLNIDGEVDEEDIECFPNTVKCKNLHVMECGEMRLDQLKIRMNKTAHLINCLKSREKSEVKQWTSKNTILTEIAAPHEPPTWNKNVNQNRPPIISGSATMGRASGFVGITDNGWVPPDPHIAVGPNNIVSIVNGNIAFFSKSGALQFIDETQGSNGFWASLGAGDSVFDPEIIYDPHSRRFIAMACESQVLPYCAAYFLLAVSDDSDPNGMWHKYRLDVTSLGNGNDIDSPNMAVDHQAVYLTADFYNSGKKELIYILEKAPLLSGQPLGITNHLIIFGVVSLGVSPIYFDSPGVYLIQNFNLTNGNDRVRLHAITDPLGASPQRVVHDVSTPLYFPPTHPPQKGTSMRIETFDSRFWSCLHRNGSLFATHHHGQTIVKARWYQIELNGWPASSNTPTLAQSGEINPGVGAHAYFNGISVDAFGNALMCYAKSSSTEYIDIEIAYRRFDDPVGDMSHIETVVAGATSYNNDRWGDYCTVVVDPVDNCTFWFIHEYPTSTNTWSTWIESKQIIDYPFTVDRSLVPAPTGDTTTFALKNPSGANKSYLILGSITGDFPGTPLPGGNVIPINWDLFTDILILNLNTPLINGFIGTLDANGEAEANIIFPPYPGLAGVKLYFAFAQRANKWGFVSNSVSIIFTP